MAARPADGAGHQQQRHAIGQLPLPRQGGDPLGSDMGGIEEHGVDPRRHQLDAFGIRAAMCRASSAENSDPTTSQSAAASSLRRQRCRQALAGRASRKLTMNFGRICLRRARSAASAMRPLSILGMHHIGLEMADLLREVPR